METRKPVTPQVAAMPGMTPLGIKPAPLPYLTPDQPNYETVWGGLARLVGSLQDWQYLGPNPAYSAHVFRLRETATTPRRVVMVKADGQEAR